MTIKLREAKFIYVKQALEWLAMGWTPYVDKDERLLPEDRDSIRCNFVGEKIKKADEHLYTSEQIKYCKRMYWAVGALENLLNTDVIRLNSDCILSVGNFPMYVGRRTLSKAKNAWGNKHVNAKEDNIHFYADFDEGKNLWCETQGRCLDFSELGKIDPYHEEETLFVLSSKDAINDYIEKRAKELSKTGVSNNKAAETIRSELSKEYKVKDGQYPSLQQIRNLIHNIIPPQKKGL